MLGRTSGFGFVCLCFNASRPLSGFKGPGLIMTFASLWKGWGVYAKVKVFIKLISTKNKQTKD